MRRFYTITILFIISLFCSRVNAQVSTYIFNQSVGTYTEIQGGTIYGTATSDDQRFVDPAVPAGGTTNTGVGLPIGFSFTYNGVSFDRLAINNNGWISLGQSSLTPSIDINTTSAYLPLSSAAANTPAALRSRIAAFGRDLQAQTGAELRLETTGTAPNRVCVIQFKNYKRYSTAGTGDNLNFQIRLNETTNTVQIVYGTIVFGTSATSTDANTAQIGLGGSAAIDFLNRATDAANDWNATVAGTTNTSSCQLPFTGTTITAPASGTTFTFTPPPPCATPTAQPTALIFSNITSTSIGVGFTAASPAATNYLVVRTSTNTAPVPVTGTTYTVGNTISGGLVEFVGTAVTYVSIGLIPSTNYYYWVFAYNVTLGTCSPAYNLVTPLTGMSTTAVAGSITSTSQGGLWSSTATWIGGVVPGSGDNAIIADGSTVTIDGAYTVNALTIGQGASGVLQWNASSNALTVRNDLIIAPGARLHAYNSAGTGQTINVGGNFINNGYVNLALASTLINFNGSTIGGSVSQTLGGSGVFEGNGTSGIIRSLFLQTTGSTTINTTQNLITSSFAHTAGSVNTNGKLTIDNTAQVYGQPINTRVANVVVTNMGTTAYTNAPVVFGAAVNLWTFSGTAALNSRYFFGENVYLATTAGTFDASSAPTHTSGIVTNGTASLLWIGTLGTLGNPFQQTAVTVGTQYFYGDNLYVCTVAGTPTATAPPVHTSGAVASGTATFLYVGTAAKVSVNFNSGTVRSLALTNSGSGYSSAPSLAFSLNGGAGAGAAATVVYIQSVIGLANSLTQKSGLATITGGLNINSTQGATMFSGVGAVSTSSGGVNYTVAPTVGFAGPTAINLVTDGGSGYTTAPTVTVTGGNLVSGTALASTNFTVVVTNGKVVSAYLNTGTTATYSVPPSLAFSAGNATLAFPAGCWPTATAVIGANGQITNFNITNAGYGYVAAPTVGIGTTTATANGGTFTTVATAPTARIALYNATLGFFLPAPSNALHDGSVLPASGKMNTLTMNSALGASLSSNLELFASSPLTLTAGELNLGSNILTFSHPSYAGASGTATASVSAGSIILNNPGGSLTRTFPYFPAVAIATGTGSLATGSTVTTLTVSRTAAPSGSIAGGGVNATGKRTYRVQANTGSNFGTNPTITLNFNAADSLTVDNPNLYIGQSTSLTGPWTIRSAASGTGALPATGSRTTAISGVGPIVPTGDDYYAWLAAEQCSGTPVTGIIAAAGSTVVCSGTTVSFTSNVFTVGVGMTYRWQKSTDNTVWEDLNGTSASAFSLIISDSVWIRRVDSCTNGGLFAVSNSIFINLSPALTSLSENFDGVTTPAIPSCWNKVGTTGTVNTQTTGALSTPNCLYMFSSSGTIIAMVSLPRLENTDAGTHRLRFSARANFTIGGVIEVGYLTNPADQSSFVSLGSYTTTSTSVYDNFELSPVTTPTGVKTLAFRHTGVPANSILIDNVIYEPIPSCNNPTNIQSSNLTSTSVDLSWDPPTVGAAPLSYSVYYSTSNTAPTSTTAPTVHGLTNPNVTLIGLTPNTNYYAWVRSICSTTDSSAWTSVFTFKTPCAPITILPWTEGFEGITTVGAGLFPDCWTVQNVSGTLPTSSTTVDTRRFPRTGTKYYHTQWNATSWVYTPGFQLTAGVSYDFSFYMMKKDPALGFTLDVSYGDNPSDAAMINPLLTGLSVTNTDYEQFKYTFTVSSTGTHYIGLKSTSPNSTPWYMSFDDFKLEVTPTCNEPTNVVLSNVTSTGVDLTWDAPTTGSSPVSYSIYYSTTNTAPSLTQAPSVHGINGPAAVLTGLTPATTYYLWVRSICSASDSSSWSAVKTFTTLCTSATSFSQSFDGVTVPALPSCWLKVGTTGTVVTQATGAFTTPNALNMNSTNTTNIAMVSMPPVSNADAGTHRLRFRIRASATVGGILEAGYLTDPLDQATFVSLGSFTTTSTTVYNDFEVTPVNTPPGVTTLAFRHTGAPANAVLIDNVVYEQIPTCNEPTNVQAANTTTTTTDLTWDAPTAGSSPISYSLYYSTTNTPPTLTTAPTLAGVNGPAVTLTGLSPASTYFLWVRSKCSPTDSSGWSNLRSFTTLCDVITALPWTEGFEGVTAPAALVFPNCWGYERTLGTNGPGTSAVNDVYRSPRTGANYLYSQWNTTTWMFTPSFQLTVGTSYDFSFYMQNKNGTAGFTMDVAYGSAANDAGMTNVLQTAYAANNTSYTLFKYTFTPTASGVYYFGVKSTSLNSTPWYLSFDDFRLEVTPSCAEPTAVTTSNITTSSADVSWTAPPSTGVTGYAWELRTSGAAGSGATGLVTSGTTANTSVNLSSLNGTTAYTFYVRTNCASPTVSSYASTSFNTLITNDECAGAVQVYATGTINVTNIGATQSLAPSLCGGFTSTGAADVWFKFVATQNGSVTMNTTGFDVIIEAYSGTCGSLTSLGCVDAAGTTETFTLNGLVAGTTYYCRIYGWGSVVTGQGNFTLNFTGTALPASITSFKGEKRGSINQLSWTTSTEVNNAGFELQRSADGVNFSSLGFIRSKADNGNSNQVLNYSFNDERPLSSVGYYRLKQMDKDGKYNYSQVVVLKSDRKGDFIVSNIYPNPVSSILNISIESTKNAKVEIVIVNTLGMKVHQQSASLVTGQNIQTMNINRLAAGLYHVQMITPNGEVIQAGKVTKQ